MPILFLLLLTLCSSNALLSQSKDSSNTKLFNKYHKSTIIAMRSAQWKKAITYADSLYTASKDRHNNQGVITALTLKGECYMKQGDLSKAYQAYQENLLLMKNCNYKGTSRGRLYKDLFILFSAQNKQDSAQRYKDIIFNLPCEKSTIIAKDEIAKRLFHSNQPTEALSWVNKNIACATALEAKSMIIGSLSLMSTIYQSIEDYETALIYIDSTLKTAQLLQDSLYISLAYDQLGIVNIRLKNYSKALDWFTKGVQLAEKLYKKNSVYFHSKLVKSTVPIGGFYTHLAAAYQDLNLQDEDCEGCIDSANFYYQKALQVHYQKNNRFNIALQLVNLAKTEKNYEAALDSLQKAHRVAPRHIDWKKMQYHIHSTRGEIYTKLEQFEAAQLYLDSAETVSHTLSDTINRLMTVYNLQNALYLAQGKYKKAYSYETKGTALYKQLQEQKRQKTLINFEIRYETKQIKQQNIVLAKERDIQELKAEQNRQFAYAAGGGLLLILIISILLVFQFRTKAIFLTQIPIIAQSNESTFHF